MKAMFGWDVKLQTLYGFGTSQTVVQILILIICSQICLIGVIV